jgi:hypothetical protein
MEGTLMSFDVEITIAGLDPVGGERLFDALVDALPETDPVASHNTLTGTFAVSLSVEAPDAQSAIADATKQFRRATTEFEDIEVSEIQASLPRAA